jgi:hypothetical protein
MLCSFVRQQLKSFIGTPVNRSPVNITLSNAFSAVKLALADLSPCTMPWQNIHRRGHTEDEEFLRRHHD